MIIFERSELKTDLHRGNILYNLRMDLINDFFCLKRVESYIPLPLLPREIYTLFWEIMLCYSCKNQHIPPLLSTMIKVQVVTPDLKWHYAFYVLQLPYSSLNMILWFCSLVGRIISICIYNSDSSKLEQIVILMRIYLFRDFARSLNSCLFMLVRNTINQYTGP